MKRPCDRRRRESTSGPQSESSGAHGGIVGLPPTYLANEPMSSSLRRLLAVEMTLIVHCDQIKLCLFQPYTTAAKM